MDAVQQDFALTAFPLAAVAADGVLPRAANHGIRYLVATDGLYREVSTPWLRAVLPAAPCLYSKTPYGRLVPQVELMCGGLPMDLIREFQEHAKEQLPNETTAVIAWNPVAKTWRLVLREAQLATPDRVVYQEVRLEDDEVMVVDIHSHGAERAYFSSADDKDDWGGLKVAAVIGAVDSPSPKMRARLVVLDRFVDLMLDASGGVHPGEGWA
jgi:PRTRC genetic system protein A